MTKDRKVDAVPSEVREVLELFETDLAEVSFPGVDAAVLDDSARTVREQAAEVARIRAELDGARAELERRQASLHQSAELGLAYAGVFAGENEALRARLAELALVQQAEARTRKRRTASRRKTKKKKAAVRDQRKGAGPANGQAIAELPFEPGAQLVSEATLPV